MSFPESLDQLCASIISCVGYSFLLRSASSLCLILLCISTLILKTYVFHFLSQKRNPNYFWPVGTLVNMKEESISLLFFSHLGNVFCQCLFSPTGFPFHQVALSQGFNNSLTLHWFFYPQG